MSRLAKKSLSIPKGVTVKQEGLIVSFKGPKGELTVPFSEGVQAEISATEFKLKVEDFVDSAISGLHFAKCRNALLGVSVGYVKQLQMIGVGYKAVLEKNNILDLAVGYSHPVKLTIPAGVTVVIEKGVNLTISGFNKDVVGQFASDVRAMKKPEPYKGKGIRYTDEHVRKKAGKSSKK